MKLLFVGTGPGARGTETHMVSLASAMDRAGHDVSAVAHPEGHVAAALGAVAIPVETGRFRNSADPRGMAAVQRALRRFRPEWLVGGFGHEYWPLLAVGRANGVNVALFRHLNSRLNPASRVLLPRLAQRFIAVSRSMRADLLAQGLRPDHVQLLYNPVDTERFRPDPGLRADMRSRLGLSDDELLVGFAGALNDAKGAFRLAEALNEAMPRAPSMRALWLGQESGHGRLLETISPALQDRHIVRGWASDMRPFYAAMDVFAMPSEWLEPFGRVSIEAQACGVPVLGSRVGGIPETLSEGKTGWLLPPGDVAAWTGALLDVTNLARDRRIEMGRAGRQHVVERFGLPTIASQFEAMLQARPSSGA